MDGLFSVEKISQQQTIINDFSKLLASALGFGANLGDVIKIWQAGLAGASKAIGDSLSTLLDGFISFNSGILTTKTSIGANISALGGSSSVGGQDYQQQVIDGLYAQLERSTTGADKLAVVGKLNTAIMARYNSELAMIGKVGTAIAGIKKYLESLKLSDKSPLTNMEKLNEARSQYNNILIKAKNGDQSALSSIQSSADAYLAEARNYYASSANYSEIFKNITDSLSQLANPAGMDQATYDAKVLELQAGSLSELQTLNNTLSDISIAEQAAYEKQNGILNASLAFLTNIANTNLTALNQPAVDMKNWAEQSMGRQLTSFESNWVSNQFNSRKAGADPSSIYTAAQPYVKTQGEITTALADVTNALGRTLTTWESDWINNQFMAGIDKATIYSQATAYINDKLSVNGSHANGLDFVPFDGYKAELHKGERVLTASQAKNDGVMSQELLMELKALRKEVERLRTDQHQQTGAIISSNYDANDKASDKVVDGTKAAAKQSVWANKSKAVIS